MDREIISHQAAEALVLLKIVDQQRALMLEHPAGQLGIEAERKDIRPGAVGAAHHGFEHLVLLLLQKHHRRLFYLEVLDAFIDNQLDDLIDRQGRADRGGDFVQNGKLLHRPAQTDILLLQPAGFFRG